MIEIPRLPTDATAEQAETWLRGAANEIGNGFHPDTAAADYEVWSPDTGAEDSTFSEQGAIDFDADMEECFRILSARVYEIVLDEIGDVSMQINDPQQFRR